MMLAIQMNGYKSWLVCLAAMDKNTRENAGEYPKCKKIEIESHKRTYISKCI